MSHDEDSWPSLYLLRLQVMVELSTNPSGIPSSHYVIRSVATTARAQDVSRDSFESNDISHFREASAHNFRKVSETTRKKWNFVTPMLDARGNCLEINRTTWHHFIIVAIGVWNNKTRNRVTTVARTTSQPF